MLISCGGISSCSVRNSSHNLQEKISKSTYVELKVKQSNDFTNRSCKKFNYIYIIILIMALVFLLKTLNLIS